MNEALKQNSQGSLLYPVTPGDWPMLERLLQDYLQELSVWTGDQPDRDGNFQYPFLTHYRREPDRRVFLVKKGPNPTQSGDTPVAGFVMIRDERDPQSGVLVHEIAEFYIRPGYRRTGFGRDCFRELLNRLPGQWQLGVLAGNDVARQFWRQVIADLCGTFEESTPAARSAGQTLFRFETAAGV